MEKVYYYLYQITNKINGKIYVGVHRTSNMDDGYMGSGINIRRAIKKYGIENFEKIILKTFDSEDDMFSAEAEIVNEDFVKRNDTYNAALGGGKCGRGMVTVRDKDGNCFNVLKDDPRYLSGELRHVVKGFVPVKDEEGNKCYVSVNDPGLKNGKFITYNRGIATVKDIEGNVYKVNINDPRLKNGELFGVNKGFACVKDSSGKICRIAKDDPRYLAGELKGMFSSRKHTKETKEKISKANALTQKGEKNSQFGTMWIYNETLKKSKKINKTDSVPNGWEKGRKLKF